MVLVCSNRLSLAPRVISLIEQFEESWNWNGFLCNESIVWAGQKFRRFQAMMNLGKWSAWFVLPYSVDLIEDIGEGNLPNSMPAPSQ